MSADSTALPDFDTLWDYSNPGLSEQRFAELLPRAEASGNIDYLAQLLSQIARAQGLQRRYDDAHATLDRASGLLQPAMHVARVRYLLERGRVFRDTLRTDEAMAAFVEAWEIGKRHRNEAPSTIDIFAVDAAHMIAITECPAEAVRWNLLALDYAASSPHPRARSWQYTLRNNLGWAYSSLERYAEAAEVFRKLINDHRSLNQTRSADIARWCMAKNLRLLGQTEEALVIQLELIAPSRQAGTRDGYGSEEIGECLLALGRAGEAVSHFAEAYEVLSKDPWFPPTEHARLQRIRQLAQLD